MAIYNEIFETFRLKQLEINKAIELLRDNGYVITKEKHKEKIIK
tara:strand:- start:2439 stop:2570 length:132 start_codon:yes stop_codon:yes gene_type:complete